MHKRAVQIGITGQSGFIGKHLAALLSEEPDEFEIVPFHSAYFRDTAALEDFVLQCDVIVHSACMNRHPDLQFLYDCNIELTERLIGAMQTAGMRPDIIYTSSIRETEDGLYGKAKRESRVRLSRWAEENHCGFQGWVIPNVFGPGAKPYYNSFIATFCHQLLSGQKPVVTENREIPLLYVTNLCRSFRQAIRTSRGSFSSDKRKVVEPDFRMTVADVLGILTRFREEYEITGKVEPPADPNLCRLRDTFVGYLK